MEQDKREKQDGSRLRSRLRVELRHRFRTAEDFKAFCVDWFPAVARRFAGGMDRTEQENLLLLYVEEGELAAALGRPDQHRAA